MAMNQRLQQAGAQLEQKRADLQQAGEELERDISQVGHVALPSTAAASLG